MIYKQIKEILFFSYHISLEQTAELLNSRNFTRTICNYLSVPLLLLFLNVHVVCKSRQLIADGLNRS